MPRQYCVPFFFQPCNVVFTYDESSNGAAIARESVRVPLSSRTTIIIIFFLLLELSNNSAYRMPGSRGLYVAHASRLCANFTYCATL